MVCDSNEVDCSCCNLQIKLNLSQYFLVMDNQLNRGKMNFTLVKMKKRGKKKQFEGLKVFKEWSVVMT